MRLFFLLLFSTVFFISSCDHGKQAVALKKSGNIDINSLKTDLNGLSTASATISTVHGEIVMRFYTKAAPVTTSRIMQLIQDKFYDGMIIHRLIPNFVVQMGDPTGSGNGGSGVKLKPEFTELQHIKGTIGLARGVDINSGDSQFYICLTTLPHLDGKYTVFGQVVEGLDVLPKLSKGDKILSMSLNIKEEK
jgi:cyclophilin family peptidyl-prolyl cis-trans isomerase